jgi:hypothetical protein
MYYCVKSNVTKQEIYLQYYSVDIMVANFLTKNVSRAKQAVLHEDVQHQIN